MKFKVGDLVANGDHDPDCIVIKTGRDYIACRDKPRKYQFVTFREFTGSTYTIWSYNASAWKNHKVVANG